MSRWIRLAARPAVIRRALGYAAVVGGVLIAINHGDAIAQGRVDGLGLLKMGLTVCVPYLVSTFSSVGAMMEGEDAGR